MARLDFEVERYAYNPPTSRLNRYRNRYKPPDVLGLSKEKFSSTSINKDTYGGYIPSSSSSNSSRRRQARRSSSLPPPTSTSSSAASADGLNDSLDSNISFSSNVSSNNGSSNEEPGNSAAEELLIHEKKSTVEEKTVKRVPRESREHLPGNIEAHVFGTGGPSRPKPLYTSYSSSLDRPQGIEFNASESREEYDKASLLSNLRRSRDTSLNHLRESKLEKFLGIEEQESEYKKRFHGAASPSKPKPNWYSWDEERAIF